MCLIAIFGSRIFGFMAFFLLHFFVTRIHRLDDYAGSLIVFISVVEMASSCVQLRFELGEAAADIKQLSQQIVKFLSFQQQPVALAKTKLVIKTRKN